jgi:hypothetical protein
MVRTIRSRMCDEAGIGEDDYAGEDGEMSLDKRISSGLLFGKPMQLEAVCSKDGIGSGSASHLPTSMARSGCLTPEHRSEVAPHTVIHRRCFPRLRAQIPSTSRRTVSVNAPVPGVQQHRETRDASLETSIQ